MTEYVFVHNPKTGGETIECLLGCRKNHTPVFLRKHDLENVYSFVFVRDPVTRLVSWYNHLLKHRYYKNIPNNSLNKESECWGISE